MRAVTLVLLVTLVAGCAAPPPAQTPKIEHRASVVLGPGEVHELNVELVAGDLVNWLWSSSAVVRFDVHHHQDGEVVEWTTHEGDAHEGFVEADAMRTYSLTWTNPGDDAVTVTYLATGDGRVRDAVGGTPTA